MLLDAISWNMLNIIRVELFFNCWKLYDIFMHSSFKSPRAQYAVASFAITLLAQTVVQFNWSWLMTVYAIYLAVGMFVWLFRRVYFYHRRLDSIGVNQTINHFEASRIYGVNGASGGGDQVDSSSKTLKKQQHHNGHAGASSSSSSSSSSGSTTSTQANSLSDNTNSLQRQRASAYRDFRSVLTEPRHNNREFATSLAHLSHISKLVADKDVFDEMHFQILATRRDVVNITLRVILFTAITFLAYLK